MNNEWVEGTAQLLRKWGRISAKRKQAHYRTANSYGWQNKLLSIPIILISTILGSLSFIHPSFLDQTTTVGNSRMLQSITPTASPTLYPTNQCFWEKFQTSPIAITIAIAITDRSRNLGFRSRSGGLR